MRLYVENSLMLRRMLREVSKVQVEGIEYKESCKRWYVDSNTPGQKAMLGYIACFVVFILLFLFQNCSYSVPLLN